MKLRIFLPPVDRPDPSTRFAWKLFDARDSVLREGVSSAAEIPHGDDVEAVLPAERVLFARLKLPKVNAATIRELLPYAVEDRLLDDPSHIHAVAGATNARGETVVTVIDRNWLRAMLDALALEGLRPARAWCESALLAGGRGDWHVVLGAERGMLVDDDGVSATFDRSPGF
ncbi:MAG: type II secretion system protein GspL, partial [Usitatibacter sp.]